MTGSGEEVPSEGAADGGHAAADMPPTLDEVHIGMELDEDNITYESDGTAVWWGTRHRCPVGTPCRDQAERALEAQR